MSHSLDPFQFYTLKDLYLRYFSADACTHRKVIRHMTSDFDACEFDLDMQMSCLNAATRMGNNGHECTRETAGAAADYRH